MGFPQVHRSFPQNYPQIKRLQRFSVDNSGILSYPQGFMYKCNKNDAEPLNSRDSGKGIDEESLVPTPLTIQALGIENSPASSRSTRRKFIQVLSGLGGQGFCAGAFFGRLDYLPIGLLDK